MLEIQAVVYQTGMPIALPGMAASPPSQKTFQSRAWEICRIAAKALAELAIALSLNLAVMAFFATPLTIPLFTSALAGAMVSVIVKTAWDLYRSKKNPEQAQAPTPILDKAADTTAKLSLINTVGLAGPNVAIHEAGHAAAAMAFFKDAKPEIKIFPFRGGQTSYTISNGMTKLGKLLGERGAILFGAAAGMMASTIFAMIEFGAAFGLKEKYPRISEFMNIHAVCQLLNEVVYGATAFLASRFDFSHDFVYLWRAGGIHPLIPIALIIALPLLELWIFHMIEARRKANKVNSTAASIIRP